MPILACISVSLVVSLVVSCALRPVRPAEFSSELILRVSKLWHALCSLGPLAPSLTHQPEIQCRRYPQQQPHKV